MGRTWYEERKALGSTIGFSLFSQGNEDQVRLLFGDLWRELLLFEKRCSRFLTTSELSQFNAAAGVKRRISPEFRDALLAAQLMAGKTGGLFNPFLLPALQRAGYVRSFVAEHVSDAVEDYRGRSVVDISELEIGVDWARIPYGTALDLGGCGKGYIGDVLATIIESTDHVIGYWLSMGGDVVAGGEQEAGSPVVIGVARGGIGQELCAEFMASGAARVAVATSTTAKRRGTGSNVPGEATGSAASWHHIIDPRTNAPADTDVATASVACATLLEADVHASNLIIVGGKNARAYAKRQGIADVLLQNSDGDITVQIGRLFVPIG